MAISFPLTTADFFGGLRVASCRFTLGGAMMQSRTEGGEIITARRGTRLWQASVTLAPTAHRAAEAVSARLAMLADAGASLLLHPLPVCTPAYDPSGAQLIGFTVTVHTLAANNVEMRLQGCPPGYTLAQGEFLGFGYGSNPIRRAVHQIVSTSVVASGAGVTPIFEVRPAIRPGALVGATVSLIRPTIQAQIVPGSANYGSADPAATGGISFAAIQTLGR